MAEVTKTKATKSETSAEIDLFSDVQLTDAEKIAVREKVGEYLIEQTLLTVGEAKSPVSGESFPRLSKSYKKYKMGEARPGVPNLEFTGNMHDQLEYRETSKGIKIGVFGNRAPVSDAHNNFSGDSDMPQRRYIPGEGQKYKSNIQDEVNRIVNEAVAKTKKDQFSRNVLSQITSQSQFDRYVKEIFEGMTKSEIRSAILGTPELYNILGEFHLLGYLVG
jgi:hypothetical protein